jgi:hypothetical protein
MEHENPWVRFAALNIERLEKPRHGRGIVYAILFGAAVWFGLIYLLAHLFGCMPLEAVIATNLITLIPM